MAVHPSFSLVPTSHASLILAMKAAFEEGRHWLEGSRFPFSVLTEHRNLEYLRSARRLNHRKARWALFFTWFQFTVSYHPGSKNTKADVQIPYLLNTTGFFYREGDWRHGILFPGRTLKNATDTSPEILYNSVT